MPTIMLPDCRLRFSSYRYSNRDNRITRLFFDLIIYIHMLYLLYTKPHYIIYDTACRHAMSIRAQFAEPLVTRAYHLFGALYHTFQISRVWVFCLLRLIFFELLYGIVASRLPLGNP